MNEKLKRLENYLSASGSTVRLVTFTTGPRLVVSSAAQLRSELRTFHRRFNRFLATGGAK